MSNIMTIIGIIILGIIGIWVYKNRSAILAPAAAAPPAPVVVPPPPAATGGINQEPTCPAGETCIEDGQGRYDCDESKGDSYEATWCGTFSGDDLTIKLYGPKHSSDGDCCWCVLHIKPDTGQFVMGGEGPHPNSNCEDKGDGESIGSSSDICVKAVAEPGPTMTGYALVDGAWKQMVTYTGPCGCDETSDTKTGDQVTFRNDGSFETTCATVIPYGGGGGGGGGTTTPPPPANGGEGGEEEEEEPADGDGEEEEESGNIARVLLAAKRRDWELNSAREFKLNPRNIKLGNF